MIDDVIRDLNVYFDSIGNHVELKARLGGHVNPSYLTVKYKGHETIFPFWSVSGGSEAEKRLARAFRDDIVDWITKVPPNDCKISTETIDAMEARPVRKPKRQAQGIEGSDH